MANKPFDREIENPRERPLSSDINLLQSYEDYSLRYLVENIYAIQFASNTGSRTPFVPPNDAGFFGDSFMLQPVSGMTLRVQPGMGFFNANTAPQLNIGGIVGLNDQSPFKPLVLTALQAFNVPAADPSNPRLDLLEINWNRILTDATSRDVLNAVSGVFAPTSLQKTMSYALDGLLTVNGTGPINYKTGVPASSPVLPALDAGYVNIGSVLVGAGVTSLDYDVIVDNRLMLFPGGVMPFAVSGASTFGTAGTCGPDGAQATFPGIRIGGYQRTVDETAIWFIAGRAFGVLNLFPSVSIKPVYTTTATDQLLPYLTGATFLPDVITGGVQTALADPSISTLPMKAAIGQPAVSLAFAFTRLNGSTPALGVPPNSVYAWTAMGNLNLF